MSNLAQRMKEYEKVSRQFLCKRMPVIIRLDGKAFHTFTKGMKRPFDKILSDTMIETTKELCENIQGCKIGYTQSDEITLLITDYDKINSEGWFSYNRDKMITISSSMATLYFNTIFSNNIVEFEKVANNSELDYLEKLKKKTNKALFDSRAFNIPENDVVNNFIWRQQDATRNSIQSVAQSQFSFNELQKKSCNNLQDMLFKQKGINWNDYPTYLKRGTCVVKKQIEINNIIRSKWTIDKEIPIFTENREFINNLIIKKEDK